MAPMAKFTEQQKLYRKIQKQFNRATKDYSMFTDGDKILVALSGGKDSLTLLQLMAERSRIFKPSISIVAAYVTMINIPYKTNIKIQFSIPLLTMKIKPASGDLRRFSK